MWCCACAADLGRKRSRLTPPPERSSSRPTLEHLEPEHPGGRTAPERTEPEGSGRRAADRLPPLPASSGASAAARLAGGGGLPSPPPRSARPGDGHAAPSNSGEAPCLLSFGVPSMPCTFWVVDVCMSVPSALVVNLYAAFITLAA